MLCRYCGNEIENDAKFCRHCGKRQKKVTEFKNQWLLSSSVVSFTAFGLAIFPWPKEWHIGTSAWMRILIFVLSLIAVYLCKQAKHTNRMHRQSTDPLLLKISTALSLVTAMVASLSLFI